MWVGNMLIGILVVLAIAAVPILVIVAVMQALARAARRDSAGRDDEQAALGQLLGDIERMEKRLGVLETILEDEPAAAARGRSGRGD